MMKDDILISIVIPIYNREFSLRYCLTSVLEQTFIAWECILVDDGSTDGSAEICNEFVKKDLRFRLIRQTNQGACCARNRGMEAARGDYIAFIDSDDKVLPSYLQRLSETVSDYDLTLCGMQLVDTDDRVLGELSKTEVTFNLNEINPQHLFWSMNNGLIFSPGCKLYKRSILLEYQICFYAGLPWGEDTLFACSYLQKIKTVRIIPDILYVAVKHPSSLSGTARYSDKFYEGAFLSWKGIAELFEAHKVKSDVVAKYVNDYYYLTIHNSIAAVQYKHKKLSLRKRFSYVKCILNETDTARIKLYRRVHGKSLISELIYKKRFFLIGLIYECKYIKEAMF